MSMIASLVNGVSSTQIDICDRGLQYGDGVFETIAIKRRQLLNFPAHLQRLTNGCSALHFTPIDLETLEIEAQELTQSIEQGVLKITLTRGNSNRGYSTSPDTEITRILTLNTWPDMLEYDKEGVELGLSSIPLARNPHLAGIKHLNRLEQVLASRELNDKAELLMLDTEENVIGGIKSNLFIRQDKTWLTPDIHYAGIAGTMRSVIIDRLNVRIAQLTLADIDQADEILLCNSIIGIWPVTQFHGTMFAIGNTSLALRAALQKDMIIA
tara:strand:- start:167323 stop:168129 length:807 start_codon:yes stop_codon:yes gene_type:complete